MRHCAALGHIVRAAAHRVRMQVLDSSIGAYATHPKMISATSVASRARWAALSSPAIALLSTSTAAMHEYSQLPHAQVRHQVSLSA